MKKLLTQIHAELIRSFTGQLFTKDQISQITSHAIGKHLSELFPRAEREMRARERVDEARQHINQASSIITDMQADLEHQSAQLDVLLGEIAEKKKLAEKYAELAQTNQDTFLAFKEEMGAALRAELLQQSEAGRALRRASSIVIWTISLFLGAALGAYFKEIIAWFGF